MRSVRNQGFCWKWVLTFWYNDHRNKRIDALVSGNRTPERCEASRPNREAVPRQNFAAAKFSSREIPRWSTKKSSPGQFDGVLQIFAWRAADRFEHGKERGTRIKSRQRIDLQ